MQGCLPYSFELLQPTLENVQHITSLAMSFVETQRSMIVDFYESNDTLNIIVKTVSELALPVIASIACIALFPAYSTIICIGFTISLAAPKSVQELSSRVSLTWERASNFHKVIIVAAATVALAYTVTLFAFSLGMYFGYKIQPAENFV